MRRFGFLFFLIGCTGYHNNTFASWLILCIMSNDLLKRITECLLMQFGDFPAHRDSTLRAKYFGHLRQRLYQSERRLIEKSSSGSRQPIRPNGWHDLSSEEGILQR